MDDIQALRPIHLTGALEPRDSWEAGDGCPVARTLQVLATRSAFLVLREALYGATRFDQFVERAQLSEPVTAARLRELNEHGLLDRVPYRDPGQRTRHEYHLTAKGLDLLTALVALFDWGDRWQFTDRAGVELTHTACRSPIRAHLTCDQGHQVTPGDIDLSRRPGRHP